MMQQDEGREALRRNVKRASSVNATHAPRAILSRGCQHVRSLIRAPSDDAAAFRSSSAQ